MAVQSGFTTHACSRIKYLFCRVLHRMCLKIKFITKIKLHMIKLGLQYRHKYNIHTVLTKLLESQYMSEKRSRSSYQIRHKMIQQEIGVVKTGTKQKEI